MRTETGASGRWKWGLAVTLALSLLVLLVAGLQTYRKAPPLPQRVVDPQGRVLATRESILEGQKAFLGYGLMEYGSILGHGAYRGPDFTAEALHLTARFMQDFYAQERFGHAFADLYEDQQAAVANQVRRELAENRYDPATGTLTLTPGAGGRPGPADRVLPAGLRPGYGRRRPALRPGARHRTGRQPPPGGPGPLLLLDRVAERRPPPRGGLLLHQ